MKKLVFLAMSLMGMTAQAAGQENAYGAYDAYGVPEGYGMECETPTF